MQEIIKWKVIPIGEPEVIKNCPKCGGGAHFESSKKFRVNANQSKLDVWLIYQCKKCKATWNMTILSRVNPKEIPPEEYHKLMNNDELLARFYAFDISTHKQNNSVLNYEIVEYRVEGDPLDLETLRENITLEIECDEVFDLRIDKVLSKKLSISREQVKKLCKQGRLKGLEEKQLWKAKLKNKMQIEILDGNKT